jgi:flavin reductase (DIM6/NTAB) family NADH-FMN oxidoreductase RutF
MSTVADPMIDPTTLRAVAGTFATGITVIGCAGPQGCTANAVLSVSLEPPLMLVSLAETSRTRRAIEAAGAFSINVLPDSADGHAISAAFAGRADDKFARIAHGVRRSGAPVLDAALGWFDCEVHSVQAAGDHTLFLGRVVAAGHREGEPLVFFRGGARALTPL